VGVDDVRFFFFKQAGEPDYVQGIMVAPDSQDSDLDSLFQQLIGCLTAPGKTPDSRLESFSVQAFDYVSNDSLGTSGLEVLDEMEDAELVHIPVISWPHRL